eukprot:5802145-Prymnesium_polylepis.1
MERCGGAPQALLDDRSSASALGRTAELARLSQLDDTEHPGHVVFLETQHARPPRPPLNHLPGHQAR